MISKTDLFESVGIEALIAYTNPKEIKKKNNNVHASQMFENKQRAVHRVTENKTSASRTPAPSSIYQGTRV